MLTLIKNEAYELAGVLDSDTIQDLIINESIEHELSDARMATKNELELLTYFKEVA